MKQSHVHPRRLRMRHWGALLALIAALNLIAGTFMFGAAPRSALAAGSLPCDIYASCGKSFSMEAVISRFFQYNKDLGEIQGQKRAIRRCYLFKAHI